MQLGVKKSKQAIARAARAPPNIRGSGYSDVELSKHWRYSRRLRFLTEPSMFEASPTCHNAPTHSPASPPGTRNVPELRAHATLPVVLINRGGLYVIIAVLDVSILGCACVLTYSFTNYSRLKRNAEEVRNYIAASAGVAKVAGDKKSLSKQPSAADDARMGDALASSVSFKDLVDAGNAISTDLRRQRAVDGNGSGVSSAGRSGRSANDTFLELARQEASGAVKGALQDGVGDNGALAAVVAARTVGVTVAYSIMAANGSTTTKCGTASLEPVELVGSIEPR
ncbi:hypothetical protein HPB49_022519 [Dermacentor silvarum]|uniref:Uncharacterized protein n=1 Tax=Dermacentor silvarum TaxID=543639 RepID=A0ACB8D8J5_DERSI|nr:hypothetical protein HPB49_022519 [Dermacentor silvarum]